MASNRWSRSSPRGPRFSLGEAARIQRDILWGTHPLLCPRCCASLTATAASGANGVSVVSCPVCDVSVVVEAPAHQFLAQGT